MPEPGRVLTRDEVRAMAFWVDGRQRRPYESEAVALARSHEQLREALELAMEYVEEALDISPWSAETRKDYETVRAALAGERKRERPEGRPQPTEEEQ